MHTTILKIGESYSVRFTIQEGSVEMIVFLKDVELHIDNGLLDLI